MLLLFLFASQLAVETGECDTKRLKCTHGISEIRGTVEHKHCFVPDKVALAHFLKTQPEIHRENVIGNSSKLHDDVIRVGLVDDLKILH